MLTRRAPRNAVILRGVAKLTGRNADSKQVGEISLTISVILLRCQPRYCPWARILKDRKGCFHYDVESKIGTQPHPKNVLPLKLSWNQLVITLVSEKDLEFNHLKANKTIQTALHSCAYLFLKGNFSGETWATHAGSLPSCRCQGFWPNPACEAAASLSAVCLFFSF